MREGLGAEGAAADHLDRVGDSSGDQLEAAGLGEGRKRRRVQAEVCNEGAMSQRSERVDVSSQNSACNEGAVSRNDLSSKQMVVQSCGSRGQMVQCAGTESAGTPI